MASSIKNQSNWSDWLNPVLVKELRQYFHNRGILITMGGLLIAQLLLLIIMQYRASENASDIYFRNGQMMFMFVAIGMGLAAFLICAVSSLFRFTEERRDRELDFSLISTITPNRIIMGKLLGAFIMFWFIAALTLPFMAIAYFLRGILVYDMLLFVLSIVPPIMIAVQLGILMGSAGKRYLYGPYYITMFLFGIYYLIIIILLSNMIFRTAGRPLAALFIVYTISVLFIGLLYALSVAAISARQANRMRPVRLFLLFALVMIPLLGVGFAWLDAQGRLQLASSMLFAAVLGGGIISAICATLAAYERHDPGLRVMLKCPEESIRRAIYLLTSSGAWGGVALSAIIMLLTAGLAWLLWSYEPTMGAVALEWCCPMCFFLFYAYLAVAVSEKQKVLSGWLIWMFVVIVFLIAPLLLGGIIAIGLKFDSQITLIATPFYGFTDYRYRGVVAYIGPFLAVLTLFIAVALRKKGVKS
ncbi:MAG: hypothetical protein LBM70_02980 [Victivallales bacterium]|jgi:hypothetical protein|nr:hypothetical protein [Victivallales bacterium]